MTSGTTTLYLPDDIEVEVDYVMNGDAALFDGASIGGNLLATNMLLIKSSDFSLEPGSVNKVKVISLEKYFQKKLDEISERLSQEHRDGSAEARADERAGR
jgi:hypothetical protein